MSITERDNLILSTLWKWKLQTTASLAFEFFGKANADAAYLRLRRLAKAGYVRQIPLGDIQKNFAWSLGKAGFAHIRKLLPELREDGYRAEHPYHDFFASVFQRGPILFPEPGSYRTVSEQELRRLFPEHLPEWVPSVASRRPDGFSRVVVKGEPEIIAFETELTLKARSRYDAIFSYYRSRREIYRVIWLVQNSKDAKNLQSLAKAFDPREYEIHLFVSLPDFLEDFWDAKFILGRNTGQRVRELLHQAPSLPSHFRETRAGIDLSQRPYNCKAYALSSPSTASDCIAVSAAAFKFPQPDVISDIPHRPTPKRSPIPSAPLERRP